MSSIEDAALAVAGTLFAAGIGHLAWWVTLGPASTASNPSVYFLSRELVAAVAVVALLASASTAAAVRWYR